MAAEQGSDGGSVRAQNTLGLFYAREESLNLDKVMIGEALNKNSMQFT